MVINNKSVTNTNFLIYRFSTRYIKPVTLRCWLRNSLGSVFQPQDHILFSRLWTVPSGLVPRVSCLTASSLSIIINFFFDPCRGLLFFNSSCLLHVMIEISWLNNILFVFKVFHHFYFLLVILYANIWASQAVLVIKNLPANTEDIREAGSIPVFRRASGGGHTNPVFLPGESHGQRNLASYSS